MSPDLLNQPPQLDPAIYKAPVEKLLCGKAFNSFVTNHIWGRLVDMDMWREDADWDSGDPKVVTWDPTSQAEITRTQDDESGMTERSVDPSVHDSVLTQSGAMLSKAGSFLSTAVTSLFTRAKEVMSGAPSAQDVSTNNPHGANSSSSRSSSLA